MNTNTNDFLNFFNNKSFIKAVKKFNNLTEQQQIDIFKVLYQRSGNQKEPFLLSCLQGTLGKDQTFDDFYQSWLPPVNSCDPIETCNETFIQEFKSPVRVLNAVNVQDPTDIMTIALIWADTDEEQQNVIKELSGTVEGSDKINEERHDNIKTSVSNRELIGIYLVEKDDNLGTPF